jgi:7,8-dihydro-6-hydroxymethylpterin-pyrophosphokinase
MHHYTPLNKPKMRKQIGAKKRQTKPLKKIKNSTTYELEASGRFWSAQLCNTAAEQEDVTKPKVLIKVLKILDTATNCLAKQLISGNSLWTPPILNG